MSKRTIKENISMILRGYRLVFQILGRYMAWNIAACLCGLIAPYFSLSMSSLVINELAYSRDAKRLLWLAGVTVSGLFLLNVLNRLVSGRVNVYGSDSWRRDLLFYMQEQNRMQYDHLENPEVTLLREKIFAAKNATGGGLQVLFWTLPPLITGIGNVVCSAALTVSLFRLRVQEGYTGLVGLLNSPAAGIGILTLIILNTVVAVATVNQETCKVSKAWQELAVSNSRYRAFGQAKGQDASIFDIHRLVLREQAKYKKPSYMVKSQKIQLHYGMLRMVWDHVMTFALFVFVAARAYAGAFGIGSFVLYRGTVARFITGVSDVAEALGRLIQNNDPLSDLFRFLDLPDDQYHGGLSVEKRDDIDYEIELRDVSFRYPRSEAWALRHVSVKFKIGERLAVVGRNGSGKTTLIKLLCRLYDPTEGKILLNGIDITRYRLDEYRRLFSVVFQDYKLFSFPIAQNVSAELAYDRSKVLSCLERVGLGARIRELERGIETPLHRDYENDGIDISGGEAQKLAIARALYKDAPFIVLDEPTAALDPLAEAEIYSQFNRIMEKKTAIYISHRLSSCRFCDRILVFDGGEIIQSGTHEELLSQEDGRYRELWKAQAQYYREEEDGRPR